ncbi:hypothetical protein CfE428DRAFT_0748 [Chthoniobacter flavus Ellin428]|uniref:Uncharacterized protein n=1 Tax=Chthoniobacter flavus Ellin428 TaxID=497964 RepID=B4CVR1_9BACT|nr:hypothetical protein [Chthoniobacter flavus]EDY21503.1 hypothetical protein CfE428DRAFT_0748 [Chthoniobacter flavus Ellin428]TCO95454.1 hypothetical protein EV701_101141 [Chthoniobacter flavus]
MPTIEANPPQHTAVAHCPLCDAPLNPEHPDACTKCDWVSPNHPDHHQSGSIRDRIAVCLSIVPGLGHFYKGHKTTGVLYFIGSLFAFAFCFLAGAASAGWGLLLMPLYWVGIMMQVYWLEDRGLKPHTAATA